MRRATSCELPKTSSTSIASRSSQPKPGSASQPATQRARSKECAGHSTSGAARRWSNFGEPFAERAAARLEDLRLAAVEDWLLAALEAGEAAGIVPELEELVASHPLRERPRELLMLALYRAGRQADALELFRRTRELFVSELGIEPSASLRELEQAMLRQDPALLGEVRAPRAASTSTVDARPRRRRGLWVVVGVAALAAAGIVAALLVHDRGSNSRTTTTADPQVRSFVYKLENFLAAIARWTRAGHARDRRRLRLQPDAGRRGRAVGSGSTEQAEPAPAGGRSERAGLRGRAAGIQPLPESDSRLHQGGLDLP